MNWLETYNKNKNLDEIELLIANELNQEKYCRYGYLKEMGIVKDSILEEVEEDCTGKFIKFFFKYFYIKKIT